MDAVNAPNKPLPAGEASPDGAVLLAAAMCVRMNKALLPAGSACHCSQSRIHTTALTCSVQPTGGHILHADMLLP